MVSPFIVRLCPDKDNVIEANMDWAGGVPTSMWPALLKPYPDMEQVNGGSVNLKSRAAIRVEKHMAITLTSKY
jgi:hypothetical protein